ncbi:MAG TPA: MFS transporter [bacterium]|jgi:putative MFS transporter|nr:MFS transporter [bacterium]
MFADLSPALRRQAMLLILVAALGYFVDIYDLLLFSMVRMPSLTGLGVPPDQLMSRGVLLLNMQMGGLLIGGILWGVLGDKKGRLSVLFGSIILYSLANLGNGLVTGVGQYAVLRLLAGVGLAGELGAGITLVAEVMPRQSRGWGTSIVAAVGILGAVVGYGVAGMTDWRHAYFIGGGLGILLLLLRLGVAESGLFKRMAAASHKRGDFFMLFRDAGRFLKYLRVIAIGLPLWYLVGILMTFSPEFGKAFGFTVLPSAGRAVALCYAGLAAGDFGSGMLSQWLRSRKRAVALFMLVQALGVALYFTLGSGSLAAFYGCCVLLGLGGGYWALFVTIGAEQFGTNIRSTVATTVPNMVRGAVVPMTLAFSALQGASLALSAPAAALAVGGVVFALALWGLAGLEETFHKDLDYFEPT